MQAQALRAQSAPSALLGAVSAAVPHFSPREAAAVWWAAARLTVPSRVRATERSAWPCVRQTETLDALWEW